MQVRRCTSTVEGNGIEIERRIDDEKGLEDERRVDNKRGIGNEKESR